MGIINLTPDSFSGDGLLRAGQDPASVAERAAERALQFEQSGADILDLGAESTRPGAAGVSAQVEMERLLPALRAIRARTALPISVDTSKAEVAREALAAGADLINDVTGLQGDPAMSETVRRAGCPAVLMHNRSRGRVLRDARLGGHYVTAPYDDLILDVLEQTAALLDAALAAGIRREQLILDPGLGFGKTVRQNLALSSWTQALRALGQPILFGSSHKSFLGQVLRLPPDQRMQASLASVAAAVASGAADIIRVHDVAAAVETVRLVDALRSASLGSPRMGGR
ncbi:MAG: dihydropteroate synthase [Chloroflexi bacterium]|nr:dihydropteroate synthase [Chloroflexota bacterium]